MHTKLHVSDRMYTRYITSDDKVWTNERCSAIWQGWRTLLVARLVQGQKLPLDIKSSLYLLLESEDKRLCHEADLDKHKGLKEQVYVQETTYYVTSDEKAWFTRKLAMVWQGWLHIETMSEEVSAVASLSIILEEQFTEELEGLLLGILTDIDARAGEKDGQTT